MGLSFHVLPTAFMTVARRRVNVSLDTLNPELFRQITRTGSHEQVMAGLEAAQTAGLKVKINVVALKGVNEDEFISLVQFAHARGLLE